MNVITLKPEKVYTQLQKIVPKEKLSNPSENFQSLGSLNQFNKTNLGIEGSASNGSFQLRFYNDHIVRVRISNHAFDDTFSYSVVGEPQPTDFILEDANGELVLLGKKLIVRIEKDPVRISFLNPEGDIICEDEKSLGTAWLGNQVTTYKKLQEGERFIGLGEKTGPLDRRGKGYVNWNTDAFAYSTETDPIYSSIPFYVGIHHNLQYGVFFDNSFKSYFNFGASNNRFSSFSADGGEMDYYFIYGEDIPEIICHYTYLTGRMELPPLWALGYHQCRYGYSSDEEVLRIADTFRMKNLPADAIALDIHHMDEFKIFTWNKTTFRDPEELISKMKLRGFNTVVICDPGIKISEEYHAYNEGIQNDIFIKYPDGSLYEGEVWPGWCHFPDFTKKECRDIWAGLMKTYTEAGVTGFWNDMNEIATWGQMMPEMLQFDFEGKKATLRRIRNLYGMLMSKTALAGAKAQMGNQRPFVLSRSGFAGIQRYAALWTGDNVSSDDHMLLGVRLVNSLGISGVPFSGYDVGGFAGEATPELFARWMSVGCFSPFLRGHSVINSKSAEPWTFGEKVLEICRNYLKLRYKLLPYIYSLFHESSTSGIPVCRSLAITHPHDSVIYSEEFQNQYFFGSNLLVAPIASTKEMTRVYLPEGIWYDFYSDTVNDGNCTVIRESPLEKLPLFVRGSGILLLQSEIFSTKESSNGILEIHIYNGTSESEFNYYEDDGSSYDYLNGHSFQRKIIFNPDEKSLYLEKPAGNYVSKFSNLRIYFHGFEPIDEITVNQQGYKVQRTNYRFIEPISSFDPICKNQNYSITLENLPYFEMPHTHDPTEIQF